MKARAPDKVGSLAFSVHLCICVLARGLCLHDDGLRCVWIGVESVSVSFRVVDGGGNGLFDCGGGEGLMEMQVVTGLGRALLLELLEEFRFR